MRFSHIVLCSLLPVFQMCGPSVTDLKELSATETYPSDKILDTCSVKKAMVIVAHDDDVSAMAGTVSMLRQKGWNVRQISLTSGDSLRDAAAKRAASVITTSFRLIMLDPDIRRKNVDSSTVAHLPINKNDFDATFESKMIADSLFAEIKSFQPVIIFSLDNELGGYGHPEHILVSQMIFDSLQKGAISPAFIFQSVYPNSMEKKILQERFTTLMKKWGFENGYAMATEMYKLEGMPEPNTQVTITGQAETKMKYLRSFEDRERKTIGFYVPFFQEFEADEYFKIFDREFFRVIPKPKS